ncbi:hypothetical protein BC938DRAFT_482130 [Jimgerdemannia flammicorona]|uniref:Uncharacterized protein n=1 Tax=Jimgerdemannia flammicorona TaxID=994334 RepID=A0A433QEK8_9FUNG|nr:hypothetical protein BC938DRAFT_482130 [Jimgerdemannia flammicorona]
MPDTIFQVMTSIEHPPLRNELIQIVENMPAYRDSKKSKIRLYFVVPQQIFATFEYQKYRVTKKNKGTDIDSTKLAKNKSKVLNRVEQWVLCIDYQIKHK